MGIPRRIRRSPQHRTISCGVENRAPLTDAPPASPTAEARIIALRGGVRWLVTVVARLVSADTTTGVESARLIVRLECLTQPHRPVRVATLRARSLHSVHDDVLRSLAAVPARRGKSSGM